MKKFFLYLLGIIPGLVQAHLNAPLKGSVYFVAFLVSVNIAIMARFWFPDVQVRNTVEILSGLSAFVVWIYAYRDLVYRLRRSPESNDSSPDEDGNAFRPD